MKKKSPRRDVRGSAHAIHLGGSGSSCRSQLNVRQPGERNEPARRLNPRKCQSRKNAKAEGEDTKVEEEETAQVKDERCRGTTYEFDTARDRQSTLCGWKTEEKILSQEVYRHVDGRATTPAAAFLKEKAC